MSNRQLSALRNMPIWIKRCERAARVAHRNGNICAFKQLRELHSYMLDIVNGVSEA
jgi:hypothetical protein